MQRWERYATRCGTFMEFTKNPRSDLTISVSTQGQLLGKSMRCLLSVFLLILASINLAAQSSVNKPGADDRVIIKSKRIVLVRSGKWAEEFPERKRAVVVYPVITGLNDRAALRRVWSI